MLLAWLLTLTNEPRERPVQACAFLAGPEVPAQSRCLPRIPGRGQGFPALSGGCLPLLGQDWAEPLLPAVSHMPSQPPRSALQRGAPTVLGDQDQSADTSG